MFKSLLKRFDTNANPEVGEEDLFFQRVSIFEDLTVKEVQKLRSLMHERTYRDEEHVFHKGQPGPAFYIVRRGEITIYQPGPPRVNLAKIRPGELFGELAILDDSPRSASAVSVGETVLYAVFKQEFDTLMVSEPLIAAKVYRQVATITGNRLKASNLNLIHSLSSRS